MPEAVTITLLPPNATPLEIALDMLAAARLGDVATPFRPLWSAQDCPEPVLGVLAFALSIDRWDPAWPIATRRARVASAIAVQRRKGTIDSVRRVIASFGGDMTIREWWQKAPVATPHTFTLTLSLQGVDGDAPSAGFVDAVIAEVTATKPLRSHFDFVLAQNARARIGLRAVARPVVYARLAVRSPVDSTPANALTFGGIPLSLVGEYLTIGA